jgi:glycosyltransferase involved in cell wall biosynthesis
MADIEGSLRAELAAQQEKILAAAQREQAMAEFEGSLRAELAAQQEKILAAAQCEQDGAARQHAELQDELVRSLALTRTTRDTKLPRELSGISRLIHKKRRRLARDYCAVASSPLFDSDWYLETNPDIAAMGLDPVLHYLLHGAAEGRRPGPIFDSRQYILVNPDVAAAKMNPLLHLLQFGVHEGRALKQEAQPPLSAQSTEVFFCEPQREPELNFDAAFVGPYYAAAGQTANPLRVWRNLSTRGAVPPTTHEEAEAIASTVRQSEFFDAEFYGQGLPQGVDPALHYVVIGEALEWAPSESFDPKFYLERHPDIRDISPLMHFQNHGRSEGRKGVSIAQSLSFTQLDDGRRPVLVICHEASRTGAPILGWNLIRDLRKKHPVVTVLMRGGVLEKDFAAESDVVVGPLGNAAWDPLEIALIAERLVKIYQPLYVVANSIETSSIIAPLGAMGVPTVALVHEFASYTRPPEKMRSTFDWATHVVFPARIVASSAFENFPGFEKRRGIHILAQGRQLLPGAKHDASVKGDSDIGKIMRSADEKDKFIVLGAGFVHIRKGVDLFLSVAAAARRLAPDVPFKFVWVGDGYKPDEDASYSVYLREQINKSDLRDVVVFLEPVADFEPAYRAADVFLLSSRLDPQPNVGIDAVTLGLPTVCFEGACGTGEVLASDPETRPLVVPHLDVEAAAQEICRLAKDPELRKSIGRNVERVGRGAYNAETYATQIDAWGCESAAALSRVDLETLRCSGAVEPELALPPQSSLPKSASLEQIVLFQSTVVGTSPDQAANIYFRRAIPGFHPQAYAVAHSHECGQSGENSTAHWLRHGRPEGPWSHPVFSPNNLPTGRGEALRVALHAHFYYPDLAPELAERLKANRTKCDLFVSTDTEAKAETLRRDLTGHGGLVTVRVMPNLGRDIGPMLTGFRQEICHGAYDLWGHLHGKKCALTDSAMGDAWRKFLWDNLIGGKNPMLDIAVAAFASDPKLGLVFAEDPHLVGWDGNRKKAEALAERMGLSRELPEFFDFPLGTMFWFRPHALRRLLALGLKWEDYPKEPLPYDGSLLHALERIVPFVTASESYGLATLRAPHSNW